MKNGQSAVPRTWRAVEIELEIARCSQAARWKDDKLIFQNLQKIQNFVEKKIFYPPTILKFFKNVTFLENFRNFQKLLFGFLL